VSAGHIDVDGLVGHRGDDVVGVGNPGVAENIVYLDPRNDVAKYLITRGWEPVPTTASELFVANGFPPVDDDDDHAPFAMAVYIGATRRLAA
jgi:hypothetical protein